MVDARRCSGNIALRRPHRYQRQGVSWEQVAHELDIDITQLAKLALCRCSRLPQASHALEQIATYVGMEQDALTRFVQKVAGRPVLSLWDRVRLLLQRGGAMFVQRRTLAVAMVAVVVVLLSAFVLATPSQNVDATLVVLEGEATVVQGNGRTQVIVAQQIVTVGVGDEIRLNAAATAQLRLYDGSTVDLSPHTTLQVTELETNASTYRVRLNMLVGRTVSRVERALGLGDAFEIRTPSSTASVRGTVFTVEVLSTHSTYFACEEGTVWVAMGTEVAILQAGMSLTAVVGRPLRNTSETTPQPETTSTPERETPTVGTPTREPTVTSTSTLTPTVTHTATPTPTLTVTNTFTPTVTSTSTTLPTATPFPLPTDTNEPGGGGSTQQVTLCHKLPGSSGNGQTITVSEDAVQAHLDHGDTLGACPPESDDNNNNNGDGGNSGNNGNGGNGGGNGGGN